LVLHEGRANRLQKISSRVQDLRVVEINTLFPPFHLERGKTSTQSGVRDQGLGGSKGENPASPIIEGKNLYKIWSLRPGFQ